MTNAKISQKYDHVHHVRKNYTLNYVYNDGNECINDILGTIAMD